MIFARRAMQRRLDELREVLPDNAVSQLASRMNRQDKDSLATMWEVVILHGLSKHGVLQYEQPLPSGRCPDVVFCSPSLSFTADITAVSDEGLDEQNPFQELWTQIEAVKTKMGLKIGGVDLRVLSRQEQTARGHRTVLKLPKRGKISDFIRDEIEPRLRSQINAGETVLRLTLEDENVGVQITIDPEKSPYSTGSHAAYNVPTIKDGNPLYKALRAKADQLRGAEGLRGIIVGDADTRSLEVRSTTRNEIGATEIVKEFFRQHSSIDFVLLISIRQEPPTWLRIHPPKREFATILMFNKVVDMAAQLEVLRQALIDEMPKPIVMPVNAGNRVRGRKYGWGYHGDYQMSGGTRMKISARELMELLAGKITVESMTKFHARGTPNVARKPNPIASEFERQLSKGRMPNIITVIKTDENGIDDWIEFEFGEPDPAISPFR